MNKTISFLSILGIIISAYLTYLHYMPEKLDTSFCNLSHYLSCATVNKSSYAVFLGIPVALIGIAGFVLLLYLSLGNFQYSAVALFYSSALGTVFMLYLLIAEIFIIKAICILCIAILLIIAAIFIISARQSCKESFQFVKDLKIE